MASLTRGIRRIVAVLLGAGIIGCQTSQKLLYYHDPKRELLDSTKTVLCVPVRSVEFSYTGDARFAPDTGATDPFFVEAVNGLVPYEFHLHFRITHFQPADQPLPLQQGQSDLRQISDSVRSLAARHHADLVAIPRSCSITHTIFRPRGWRGDKYGRGNYARPVSYAATTSFQIQIWDGSGELLYEKVGTSSTGKPIAYSLPDKRTAAADSAVSAREFFAPPLVGALYKSIRSALTLR